MKMNCASCHSAAGWEISATYWSNLERQHDQNSRQKPVETTDTLSFHHSSTGFELEGRHAKIDCRACHESLVFSEAETGCISCHVDIHQQTLGNDCARCHSSNNWLIDNINELHQQNGFPLIGVHTALDCASCHTSSSVMQYNRIGNDCISCHKADFNATTNPDHEAGGFSTDCLECHDLFSPDWNTDQVNHDFFPLTKGHEISDCARCHVGGDFANTPTNCFACHQADYNGALSPNHHLAGFSNDCAQCHTTDPEWMPAQYVAHDLNHFPIYSGKHNGQWTSCAECHTDPANYSVYSCTICHTNPETDDGHGGVNGYVYENTACLACHPTGDAGTSFDHNSTNFPLTGAHLQASCTECHANGYAGTPTDCVSCHNTDFTQAYNPNHVSLNLPTDCASCHTTEPGWAPASFAIHDTYYPLNGAHSVIALDCATCHNGDYNNTPTTCNGCHNPDYLQANVPNHVQNQFPTDCATCHSESAWAPSTFDHNIVFPLTGAHSAIANDCAVCHINGNYTNTPNTCAECHNADYNSSTNPNHVSLGLPTDCETCHTTAPGWEPALFPIHNNYYPLNGAHAVIANDCATCHNGNYNSTPNTCVACHETDYANTTAPNHAAAQFPQECASCHTESAWEPATFDHDLQYFPIYSGEHNGEWSQCTDCHLNPSNYAEFTCITCHTNPQTDEEHTGVGGYVYNSAACLACHPTGDADLIFDHNTTNFPLTGAHLSTDCISCHAGGFEGTSTDCATCHTIDFNQAMNPNHVALNIPMDCASCHSTAPGWAPASFAIHNNYYALNGAHAAIAMDCAACHNGNYNSTPNTCNGCHTGDYNAATAPNHLLNQFPTDCASCHSESAWTPSTFDHNTFYPFTGAHLAVATDCIACHQNGNYSATPNTCNGCHAAEYTGSANPNHQALGIPTDCESCHSTAPGWAPASFAIHNDYYPLNGAHAAIANDCATCHNGDYNNTPATCFACHSSEFTNTTNPNHTAAQFPTDCASCHTETAWDPAIFDHDGQYFPIYSGAHDGEWSQCIECHFNPNNYAEVSCIGCHTNPETDDQHTGVNGYVYNSSACLACHPTGDATSVFDHNSTGFPLTGAHISVNCMDCHTSGFQTPLSTECVACHQVQFNQAANPNHQALNLSTDCVTCHTTAPSWEPALFPIHNNYYQLNGAHAAIANDCAVCHNGNYNNTPNTCNGCHNSEYSGTTNPNHAVAQFPTDCALCHTETAWTPSTFDHNVIYPLTGAHAGIANDCALCHVNGNYNNTPNTCNGCHSSDYSGSTNPNHVSLGIPTDCESCHTTAPDWEPALFPIHNNYYQLNGAHALISTDCAACHNGNYNNTPNTCVGCHLPEYTATSSPNHSAAQFPTDCIQCHSETAWVPSTFDHNVYYPLTGAHASIANDCALCHVNGNYNNTPNTCNGCHSSDYSGSTNPNHVSLGLPTDCESCHTTEPGWAPALFPIHNNYYQLNGAHAVIANDCVACHNGNYNNTPNTCFGCHAAEYNSANNPNHLSAQFPTACANCHTETAWTPSTFDHDQLYFPIYSGKHEGEWNQCNECHTNPNNYSIFSCIDCHEHDDPADMADKHQGVSGYSYNSAACYSCHPTGED
ncbi:MAG: hypothetical protein ACK5SQ_09105 [Chitinophagales bacterium]